MRDLRAALHEAAPRPRGQLDLERAMKRGRVLAWRRRGIVALLSLITCVAVWTVATSIPAAVSDEEQPPAHRLPSREGCSYEGFIREIQGAYGTVVTEVPPSLVEIASGKHEGSAWSLCAYLKKVKGSRGEWASDKGNGYREDHVCVGATYAPDSFPTYGCFARRPRGSPRSDYPRAPSGVLRNDAAALYYGTISQRVRRVLVRSEAGTVSEAKIHGSPGGLSINHRFYVAFARPHGAVTITVEDGAGRELDARRWTPGA